MRQDAVDKADAPVPPENAAGVQANLTAQVCSPLRVKPCTNAACNAAVCTDAPYPAVNRPYVVRIAPHLRHIRWCGAGL